MLRKLKLYGELADFVGHREFEIEASTIPKVMSFLVNNFPKIEAYINPKYYQVKIGNYSVGRDELLFPIGSEDVHIVPVISGAGGNVGKILLGAALIGLAFATAGTAVSQAGGLLSAKGFAAAGFGTKALLVGGAALALQGVTDMLFPLPQMPQFGNDNEEDPKLSYNFSGTQNTGRAGTPVPVVYGEIVTGSVVISGAIDTEQVQA